MSRISCDRRHEIYHLMLGPYTDIYRKAKRLRKADPIKNKDLLANGEGKFSVAAFMTQTLFRPFHMLVKEPILIFVTLYISMVYAVLYARKSHVLCLRYLLLTTTRPRQYSRRFPSSSSVIMDSRSAKMGLSFSASVLGQQSEPYPTIWRKVIDTRSW